MNIALYADPQSPSVQQLISSIEQNNWIMVNKDNQQPTEALDYAFYVISPIEAVDQQIPECIPQLIDDSNKKPQKTIYCYLTADGDCQFSKHQVKSLNAIGKMIQSNGATWLTSLPLTHTNWLESLQKA